MKFSDIVNRENGTKIAYSWFNSLRDAGVRAEDIADAAAANATAAAASATSTASAVATHEADTTNIHGIADTSALATKAGAEVLTNKDIDGGTASNTSRITLPKNTKANLDGLARKEATIVYATDQAKAYLDTGSTLIPVGSGSGSSGVNYVNDDDSNFENGIGSWATDNGSGSASTVLSLASETTNILRGSKSLKIAKSASSASGHFAKVSSKTIDVADRGKVLWGSLEGNFTDANYASGDLTIEAYDLTNAAVIPAYVEGGTSGAFNSGKGQYIFRIATSTTTASIQVRIKGNSTNAAAYNVYVDDVKFGPQEYVIGFSGSDWQDLTKFGTIEYRGGSNGSLYTNLSTTYAKARRVGDTLEINVRVAATGLPGTGTGALQLVINGIQIDTDKYGTQTDSYQDSVVFVDSSAGLAFSGSARAYNQSGGIWILGQIVGPSGSAATFSPSGSSPVVWASGDYLVFKASFPIATWVSGTILSNSRVEYAYNSSTSTTSDSTSFGYGSGGVVFQSFAPAGTGNVSKRVRFQNTIGVTDKLWIETDCGTSGARWVSFTDRFGGFGTNNTISWGVKFSIINATDVDVYFYNQITATTGDAWSGITSWKWRLCKASNPLGVETATKEFIQARVTSATNWPVAVSTYGDLTSIPLTPGEWDLTGIVGTFNNGAVTSTIMTIGISTTSGNSGTGLVRNDSFNELTLNQASGARATLIVPNFRVSVTAPTTYYLKGTVDGSVTNLQYACRLSARRIP
jgi:hypothetical protein